MLRFPSLYNKACFNRNFTRFSSKTFNLSRTPFFALRPSRTSSFSFAHRSFASSTDPVPLQKLSETFLNGTNSDYVDQMYEAWKKDPSSVHVSWQAYFKNVEKGLEPGKAFSAPPSFSSSFSVPSSSTTSSADAEYAVQNVKAKELTDAFRRLGHIHAKLDPLGLKKPEQERRLDYKYYGFTEKDLEKEFTIEDKKEKFGDMITRLEKTYCSSIGAQFMHIENEEQRNWFRDRFEAHRTPYSKVDKKNFLDRLLWATQFENFLKVKWSSTKRFGLDGSECLIPGIKSLIDHSADLGVENVVIGMPHRGRLNVLANVVKKPLSAIFKEFSKHDHKASADQKEAEKTNFSFHTGDVKYHLGTSYTRETRTGKKIHLALLSNPSHLEAVDPLVEGKARAKQYYTKDHTRKRTMTLQLHGDAAFAGQGIVYETLQMSGVPDYTTGGAVHVVVNNQVGFTTDPEEGRSTRYCTDIAKAFDIPVFHVNCDDVESVIFSFQMAAEWRYKFGKDVLIDFLTFRRWGHNEIDEPMFTQPVLYNSIHKHPTTASIYTQELISEGTLTLDDVNAINSKIDKAFQVALSEASSYQTQKNDWFDSLWKGFKGPAQLARIQPTGVKREKLLEVGKSLYTVPSNFKVHNNIARDLKKKQQMFETGKDIDWATAEALAFGTLLLESNHVRLSGQDVERGTFSHRHSVLTDQATGEKYTPLQHISKNQSDFTVCNSILSEFAVLGFELGYALENPNALILWEAQFGDFANGAQVIIDQFISCGEQKWERQNGLVMLLPHGYDGQGPEHSSARLERFLQLSDSDPSEIPSLENKYNTSVLQNKNWVVANVTTPANYFHLLRRQVHREFRKPLIVMSPKALLRVVKSDLDEFEDNGTGIRFLKVLPESSTELVSPDKIRKLIFCSGQVYYQLVNERTKRKINDVAIVRIEQLMPFPFYEVREQLSKYSNAKIVWAQEEHKNMGAWTFINPHITYLLPKGASPVTYVGRRVSASPATGDYSIHQCQQEAFLDAAMS